jgi:hypothetical protein
MKKHHGTRVAGRLALGTLALGGLALTACGSDATGAAKPVTVTMSDYKYGNLPKEVKAGTTFEVVNESKAELHEFVAIALPAGEKRTVAELVKLPEAELAPLLSAQPATVMLAPPGGAPVITAVGDGSIATPGRYVILCAIPTGAKPQEYLDAVAKAQGQKPEGVAGGPPHFVSGMAAELIVK